jgi:hypothetical protein
MKYRVWQAVSETNYVIIEAASEEDALLKFREADEVDEINTASQTNLWVEPIKE